MSDNQEPKWDDTDPLFEETEPLFEETSEAISSNESISLPELPDDASLVDQALEGSKGAAIGGGIGYLLGKPSEKAGEALQDLSDKLRFESITGESPKASRKFLKDFLQQGGESEAFITPSELGKTAKEQGIGKLFQSEEKAYLKAQQLLDESAQKQSEFIKNVDLSPNAPKVSDAQLYENMLQEYQKSLSPREASTQYKELNRLFKDSSEDKLNTLAEVEQAKSSLPFERDAEKNLQKSRNIRGSVYRQTTEDALKTLPNGEELLSEFKNLKKGTASAKILEEALLEGASKSPSIMKGGIGSMLDKATDIGKKTIEPTIDIVGKGLAKFGKALPVVGAVIGATTGAANAKEGNRLEGAMQGLAENAIPFGLESEKVAVSDYNEKYRKLNELKKKEDIDQGSEYVKNMQKNMDYKPEELQQLSEQMLQTPGGETYADMLNKAANSTGRDKNSIMFGLNQQPAFRQLMKRLNK